MPQKQWTAVDQYIQDLLIPADPALEAALQASAAAGLPSISVSPAQGRLLFLLAQFHGARNILELGTLGGYSTICLARALPPGGRVTTLEAEPKHAQVARGSFTAAGLDAVIDLRLGKAIETLPQLAAEGRAPFDLFFIDADKPNIPLYFEWALKLCSPGAMIIVDNVVREGALADAKSEDASVQGVRRFHAMLATQPGVTATTIQTVGSKGYDGFTLVRVNREIRTA
jgi:predicted O-methyltransferase YrrM